MVRVALAIEELLSQEPISGEALQRVAVARVQAASWDWVLLWMTPAVEQALRTLLSILAPFRAGELLLAANDGIAFYARRDFVADTLSQGDSIVRQVLQEAPHEVQQALQQESQGRRQGSVLFMRVQRDGTLSDVNSVLQVVRESTWFSFRALPTILRRRHLDISLGAQKVHVETLPCLPIAAGETDIAHVSVFRAAPSGFVTIRSLTSIGAMESTKLSSMQIADALGISLEEYYGFSFSLPLEVEILWKSTCRTRVDVMEALRACAAELHAARDYCQHSIERSIDVTIRLLETRRRRALKRKRIAIAQAGKPSIAVGPVPTNEHEVLILAGKLETHIAGVLPEFHILEHTSQVGIDALADIRISTDSAPVRNATLEFEYELSNFFKHSHPIRQTDFIVCWSNGNVANGKHHYGDGSVDRRGELVFDMRGRGWIRVLDFGNHLIRVFILRDFPGLCIQEYQEHKA